jgi:hypothetical protein
MINYIVISILLITCIILLVILVPKFIKSNKLAKEWRSKIQNALKSGNAVLFTTASKLSLNGKDISEFTSVVTSNETAIILEPGSYDTLGSYPQFGSNGKLIKTFDDLKLTFTAKSGQEYEMGIYHFAPTLMAVSASFRLISQPEGEREEIALACIIL